MEKKDIQHLIDKYRSGAILTPQEQLWLDSFYLHQAKQAKHEISATSLEENLSKVEVALYKQTSSRRSRTMRTWWYSAAASVLIAASVSLLMYNSVSKSTHDVGQRAQFESITAGSDKALLVLANGDQFVLDGANNITNGQGDISIDGQQLGLSTRGIISSAFNTLQIPKGGQFKIVLSDGSEVWLNAGSQLRYPTTFDGDKREVELIGEAYFEITHNPKKPFMVRTKDQYVQVLGTGFNISSYPNTTTTTTLAHGKVRVASASHSQSPALILSPGEQAFLTGKTLEKKTADVESILAWKNGVFKFKKSSLKDITAQLERWYDVDFVFRNKTIPTHQITGEIQRKVNLYEIIEILSYFGIDCKIDGRTVYLDQKK
ncbi:FecR family protein [Sphingobacterium tabacisoli]|uniref:FecR family protein n=1 Tax=Sphingobacterium tabacisoli TaxID=2044855 RepID=A0ABW5L5R0_9SPHI|nr:FecR family protein [Sphingobacterium tabacisoli]